MERLLERSQQVELGQPALWGTDTVGCSGLLRIARPSKMFPCQCGGEKLVCSRKNGLSVAELCVRRVCVVGRVGL